MIDFIFNAFADFYYAVGADGVFKFCLKLLFVAFAVWLSLSIFVKSFSIKKRLTFCIFALGDCVSLLGTDLANNQVLWRSVALLGVGTMLSAIIFSVRVKQSTVKEKKALVKFIDGCINKQKENKTLEETVDEHCVNTPLKLHVIPTNNVFDDEIEQDYNRGDLIFTPRANNSENLRKSNVNEVDFSHVKSVMERLSTVPLLPSDKKQITDLEKVVHTAETTGVDGALKSKINDGLSALLKIMAKYGV